VKLIAFSADHLRLDQALPFGVRDVFGRLLLNAGATIRNHDQLEHLRSLPLWADEAESTEWRRRLGGKVYQMVRGNASLKAIAHAQPITPPRDSTAIAEAPLADQWESLAMALDAALRDAREAPVGSDEPGWLARLASVHQRAERLGERWPDASLYHLIHNAGQSTFKYSCHHALLTMLVCRQAAALLEWDAARVRGLGHAALTMNVAMVALQDQLAASRMAPSAAMREQIRGHAAAGAALLRTAGVADALWCDVVALHHDAGEMHRPLAELDAARQAARLLRRADIFTAKISRRSQREPMSPVQAAREACLGADGGPDEIGSALLRATGLYPPGSFVELVNGERGIVVARGRRANLPWVASLVAPSGLALGEPALRDTLEARYAVRAAVAAAAIKVRPDHTRILALR
jgi:HD-GYP domain-containing protein (c-di-GMP phosphodiesterase class II)